MPSSDTPRPSVVAVALGATALVALAPVDGLSASGQYAVATMVFAAVLWITGALPLPLTALFVPILLTVFGVYPGLGAAVAGFADPVVFLLLAGFMLAEALQAHGIDRRIALRVLLWFGTSSRGLVLGVMVATASLSMVVSNTATVAMMVPVVLGIVDGVTDLADVEGSDPEALHANANLRIAMLLGVAYAASLGGIGTIIGTPPNAIVVGQLSELVGYEITFLQWMAISLPVVVVTLPVAWALLTYVVYPPASFDVTRARERARTEIRTTGPLSSAGRRTVVVFAATACLWVLGGVEFLFVDSLPAAWRVTLFGGDGPTVFGTLGHAGVFYYVLVGLAAVPALVVSGAAAWDDLVDIDWGTLILLGGGLSLANALADTDATRWMAEATLGTLTEMPVFVVILAVIAGTVLVGELASNTAVAAILAPLLIHVGPAYATALGTTSEMAAVFLAVTGAIAASFGFALPVATPPNAIVFGTGHVRREQMLRAGGLLDAVVVVLTAVVAYLLIRTVWPVVLG